MSVIGIVGAGQLGFVLAERLVALGHTVKAANTRGPDSLRDFARSTGVMPVGIGDVASGTDMLILAIPLAATPTLRTSLGPALREVPVIVDAGNYVPTRDGRIAQIESGTPESVWVSDQLALPVVKAFNSISDVSLSCGGRPDGARDRIALPVCGDHVEARAVVMRLVEELGFAAWDAGPLSGSWRQQIGQPAYCTDGTLKQLPKLLARARSETVVARRDAAMALMSRLPPDFPKATLVQAGRLMAGLDRHRPKSWLAILRLGAAIVRRRGRRAATSARLSQSFRLRAKSGRTFRS